MNLFSLRNGLVALLGIHTLLAGGDFLRDLARVAPSELWSRWRKSREADAPSRRVHPRLTQELQKAKGRRFETFSRWALHVFGATVVVGIGIDAVGYEIFPDSTTVDDQRNRMLQVVIGAYTCIVVNFVLQSYAVKGAATVFYGAIIAIIMSRQMGCEQDPTFFFLQSLDVLLRLFTSISMGVAEFRFIVVGELGCFFAAVSKYESNVLTFHAEKLAPGHGDMWLMWSSHAALAACGIAYFVDQWFRYMVTLQLEAQDAMESLERILSAVCDTVCFLDEGLRIKGPSSTLLHMLSPGSTTDDAAAVEGRSFVDFIQEETEKGAFASFACGAPGEHGSPGPATSLHLHLIDTLGRAFRIQLFHTQSFNSSSNSVVHLLGIRYHEDKDDRPDMDMADIDIAEDAVGELVSLQQHEDVRMRHVASVPSRAPSLSACAWRCPRCNATAADWGDAASTASASVLESLDSFADIQPAALPQIVPPPPPAAESVDEVSLGAHLETLHDWAPEICQEVLESMNETHASVCAASASLEEVSQKQHDLELEEQVRITLLVGKRLESAWPGLRLAWLNITHMVVGARPVPIRTLGEGTAPVGTVVAMWLLPQWGGGVDQFPLTDIWDSEPQKVYENFRAAVMEHARRLVRRSERAIVRAPATPRLALYSRGRS